MRRAAKVDANQPAIVAALRKCGASVIDCSKLGAGFPDLIVGAFGRTALVEVKDGSKPPSRRQLTPDQQQWHAAWRGGTLAVVCDVESALRVLSTMQS